MKFINTDEARKGFEEAIASMIVATSSASVAYQFYGHLIGKCRVMFSEDLPAPAGVRFYIDHYEMVINPKEFNPLPLKERLGILKHEMLHILLGHVHEGKDEVINHEAANIAQDCAINQMITRDHLPSDCIFPDQIGPLKQGVALPLPNNQTWEHYYGYLDLSKCNQNQNQNGNGDCPDCGGSGKDSNDEGEGNGEGEGKPCPSCNGTGKQPGQGQGNGGNGVVDDHAFQNTSEGDSDLQKDITKQMLDSAVESTQKGRGDLPGNLDKMMELFTRKAQVSWQKVLRNIVGNKRTSSRRTIMRSDRRFPKRDDLRGKTKNRTFSILFIGDESGSMCDNALTECVSETLHICDITKTDMDYIAIDTQPHPPVKLKKGQRKFNRQASGGTNLNPALEMAKEHNLDFQAIVVATDGWLSESDVDVFRKTGKKVIWLIESRGQVMDSMSSGLMQAFKLKPAAE